MDVKLEHGPRVVRWLVVIQRAVCVLLLAALLVLVLMQVISRYVFGSPLGWTAEAGRFVFIWLTFIAAAFVMGEARHIAVDVIGGWVGRRGRVVIEWFATAVAVTVAGMILIAVIPFAWERMAQTTPAADIPRGLWYFATVVGMALMGFHAMVNAVVATIRGEPVWAQTTGAEAELSRDLADDLPGLQPDDVLDAEVGAGGRSGRADEEGRP